MKSKPIKPLYWLPAFLIMALSIGLIAWQQKDTPSGKNNFTDTIPKKKTDKKNC